MKIRFIVKDNENQPVEGAKVNIKYGLADTILLTTHPQSRFNNVEGPLTVQYDQSKGTLKGEGGSVESFEHSFLPTDLVPVPNPYSPERLIIKHRIEGNFIRIYYTRAYVNEKITAKPNLIVDFINVGEINP